MIDASIKTFPGEKVFMDTVRAEKLLFIVFFSGLYYVGDDSVNS